MHSLRGAPALFPGSKSQPTHSTPRTNLNPSLKNLVELGEESDLTTSAKKKSSKRSKKTRGSTSPPITPKQKAIESFASVVTGSSATSVLESIDEYVDDFEDNEVPDSDDEIPTVDQLESKRMPSEALTSASSSKVLDESEGGALDLRNKPKNPEPTSQEEALKAREEELKRQMESYRKQQQQQQAMADTMKQRNIEPPPEDLVEARPSSSRGELLPQDAKEAQAAQRGRGLDNAQLGEFLYQREREYTRQFHHTEEEGAVRYLFQRLVEDVREVFRELNLAIITAEKERLLKDGQYQKEREARDKYAERQSMERLLREVREREEREQKFLNRAEERDREFRALIEERLKRDEEEREARLKRDIQDSAERARKDRELRNQLESLERERRSQATADALQRDNLFIQSQIENIKSQYAAQLEDIRNQNELQHARLEEFHRSELEMIQKRHEADSQQLLNQHAKQLALAEAQFGKVDKLERILESLHTEIEAAKKLSETLTEERLNTLQSKEQQLEEQSSLLHAMMDDLHDSKQQLEKERARISTLYAKFEVLLGNFTKNAEEDRRQLQEARTHMETLRQQTDRDRKLMLSEIFQERKVLEQQTEEFFSRRMQSVSELQEERLAISRERIEAAVARERQNRDETELLKSLRAREEEYAMKIESINSDRSSISEMKVELKQAFEKMAADREAIRKEREIFELEKQELLSRFDEIRRRAHDAARAQEEMRAALIQKRVETEFGIEQIPPRPSQPQLQPAPYADPGAMVTTMTNLQIDLAHQRAILEKMSM